MKTTVATRFCCSSPLIDLFEKTLMFTALILQYLNKMVESKIRDLTSPQPFHAVKVQRFKDNRIKLLTKFRGELPVKVFALVRDFPIQACDLSYAPPPTVRTLLLTTEFFVERPKFLQGLLQRLGVLFLFTRAERQICVFHAKICPNAFTCCRQRSKICVSCCYANPILPTSITLYRNLGDSSVPLAVFVKSIGYPIKLPLTGLGIPFSERQCNMIVEQTPASRTRIGNRLEFVARFDMRSTPKFLKETVIPFINTQKFLLYCLARQYFPVRMRCFLQVLKVGIHSIIVRIRQTVLISLTVPFMEVFMHLPHIVKQIANTNCIRLIVKRIFIGFHGLSGIRRLSPSKWEDQHIAEWQRLECWST